MKKIIDMLKSMTNSKKKVFALALATCVIVLSIAGSSIAYFTDTAKFTNTFTAGKVDIKLTEAKVTTDDNGNFVQNGAERIEADDSEGTQTYGSVFPKQTIYKDPTITNIGSESAFVGAIITITSTNIGSLLDSGEDIVAFITGLPSSNAVVKASIAAGVVTIYVVFNNALGENQEAVAFKGIKIADAWTNDDMAKLNGLEIVVDAYAVQAAGMSGSLAALQEAFATQWGTPYNNATVVTVPTT